jgi:uncharacterized protein with ATP-grasp and redox domains
MTMKAAPDCIECMFRQALNTARKATDDPIKQLKVLARLRETPFDLDQTPAAFSQPAYAAVNDILDIDDPYVADKQETNQAALKLLPTIQEKVDASDNPLDAALHAAVAGNIIDLGVGSSFNLATDIQSIMAQNFAINHFDALNADLATADHILYVGDNAGEIVLDTILVSYLKNAGKSVCYSVKSGPIINDATMEDAVVSGMTEIADVIETGSNDIGVNWRNASEQFISQFESADIVICKGHGNFETCLGRKENIYFLLKTKCQVVADELNVPLGSIVLSHKGTPA